MSRPTTKYPLNAYRIEIQGDLTPWKGRLGVLRMTIRDDRRYGRVTILRGLVRDQAALFGVLNTIYELHLPLLRVEALTTDNSSEESSTDN